MPCPPRPSKLAAPIPTLAEAYLKCRGITTSLLEPEVDLDGYPAGYFGDWAQDGLLAVDRAELTDESEMMQLFELLAEAIGDAENSDENWITGETPNPPVPSPGECRRILRFLPDLAVNFVGPVPLRVELSLAQGRVLLRAGDKWDIYSLDRQGAKALKKLLRWAEPTVPAN
ncbi:MAG TPA: hypothetical protein VG734_03660, partial [Lacunisphaera sp.]|nr:hypothetical protein [Lacunisphaera sp.]